TWFANSRLNALVILRQLEAEVGDVARYLNHPKYPPFSAGERAAFEKRLDWTAKKFGHIPNAKTSLDVALKNIPLDKILVLADPDASCNFDRTTLQFANGDKADPLSLLKINLFVRLWKKLGWTIEETDRTLRVFLPKNSDLSDAKKLGEAFKTALLYLAHLKALDARV